MKRQQGTIVTFVTPDKTDKTILLTLFKTKTGEERIRIWNYTNRQQVVLRNPDEIKKLKKVFLLGFTK